MVVKHGHTFINIMERYYRMVLAAKDSKLNREFEIEDEKSEYRSERTILVRDLDPERVMNFVSTTSLKNMKFK